MATLFTIAKTWKQPKCPSADEWIKKLWYIYTMEYYSAIKRNAFESVLMRWMNLEPNKQSEGSQKEKTKYHILMNIYGIYKDGTDEPCLQSSIGDTNIEYRLMDKGWREEGEGEINEGSTMDAYRVT